VSKERFQRTGMNSFYGEFFCDAVVPKDDFLRMLGQVVPSQRFTYKLLKHYKGKARMGRRPYDPAVLLKDIVRVAQESGVVFGSLQIIDSTHTVAIVPAEKDAWDDGGYSEAGVRYNDGVFHWFYGGTKTLKL